MSVSILFKNARLIFPDRVEPADLRVCDGRIASIGRALEPERGDDVQMLGGRLVAPGCPDIERLRTLVGEGIPLTRAVYMSTLKGRLEPGADADLTILSEKLEVLATFAKGKRRLPEA